jgi:hypothetical protein
MRLALSVVLLASLSSQVKAQPRDRLAVGRLEITAEPGTPAERLAKLHANLVGGFAAVGWTVISDEELRASSPDPSLQSCQSDACFKALGDATKAQWVLAGSISNSAPSSFAAELRLIEVASGRTVATYSNTCGVCTNKDANEWLALVAADLKQQAVASRPASKPDAAAANQTMLTNAPLEPPTRTQWILRGAGIAAGVLGLAGVVFGFVEVGRDATVCDSVPAGGQCVRHRDTTNGQIFGFATGFPLLAASALMSYYGWRHAPKRLAFAPAVSPQSVSLSAGWQF